MAFKGIKLLTTQQEHALPSFPFAAGPGVSTWRVVTLHLGIMYVFVSYAIKQGRGWLSQTSIFWRHEDVLAFCKQVNKDKRRKLLDVYLLVPTPQDAAHRWSFVPIGEVFVRQDNDHDGDFPLYVTVDGETVGGLSFGSPDDTSSPIDHQALERVFPAQTSDPGPSNGRP